MEEQKQQMGFGYIWVLTFFPILLVQYANFIK